MIRNWIPRSWKFPIFTWLEHPWPYRSRKIYIFLDRYDQGWKVWPHECGKCLTKNDLNHITIFKQFLRVLHSISKKNGNHCWSWFMKNIHLDITSHSLILARKSAYEAHKLFELDVSQCQTLTLIIILNCIIFQIIIGVNVLETVSVSCSVSVLKSLLGQNK
jgi:hypothetical protein